MPADDLLDSLDPEQREVATALHGPVCVLAGAGTGKTRAITHRIAYGVRVNAYAPQSVLALTFTARAAGEMRERLRRLGVTGVQARTFHAAALRQLSYFWPQTVGGQMPSILDHKAPLVGRAARAAGISLDRLAVRDVSSEIEWAKVSLISAQDYAAAIRKAGREAPAGLTVPQVVDVMRAYEEAKTESVVVDFEDILLLLADVVSRHVEVGDQIRRQYRHFVVDEYQDVSPLQQYLLDQWMGGREELCVVGDPAQTIYSFAGATADHLTGFTSRHEDAAVVRLVRNYRSTPQVVTLANRVMRSAGSTAVQLRAERDGGPEPAFLVADSDETEAATVAERIESLIRAGTPASGIAVLYRINSQSEAVEEALAERGIGYVTRGGVRFFERPEVKQAVILLRGAAVADDDSPVPERVRSILGDQGWSEKPPTDRGAVRERWDSLQALVQLADDMDSDADLTMRQFVEHLAERAQAQHAPSVDGVTLSTVHAAKGLEWSAVFVIGCSEGLLPLTAAETPAAVDEERRLLYVAITRARDHLTLSYARSRRATGRSTRKVSRFLTGVWPESGLRSPSRAPRAADELDGADAVLFEALREWRAGVAAQTSKPAFTILVDVSLAQIAMERPASPSALARVHGVGATKLQKYGEDVLRIVSEHS